MRFLQRQVILEYDPPKDHTLESGIILDTREPNQQVGKVIFVGLRCKFPFVDKEGNERLLQPGDNIYFKREHAHREKFSGVEYLVLNEDFVLGVKE